MNKKGQALIEFILIIPIAIMMMLAFFDGARIFQEKMKLESLLEDVILKDNVKLDNIMLNKSSDGDKTNYELSSEIELSSPILTAIFDKKYKVNASRVIYE